MGDGEGVGVSCLSAASTSLAVDSGANAVDMTVALPEELIVVGSSGI